MARDDPFPGRELLTIKEVMRLIGLGKTEFYEFLKEEGTGFPKAVVVGTKAARKRWKKAQVLAYIDLLSS